jgi:hypothetical protein
MEQRVVIHGGPTHPLAISPILGERIADSERIIKRDHHVSIKMIGGLNDFRISGGANAPGIMKYPGNLSRCPLMTVTRSYSYIIPDLS